MLHALVTQMLNALEHQQSQTRPIHKTEFAIIAARNYLVIEPDKQRADLVTQLRACLSGPATLTTQEASAIEAAANMLEEEEYAREIESLECDYTDQVLRAYAAEKVSMTKLQQIELQAQLARKEAYILELEAK